VGGLAESRATAKIAAEIAKTCSEEYLMMGHGGQDGNCARLARLAAVVRQGGSVEVQEVG